MHKQNIYTKPYSTTHPIGLALNYQPNHIKLDTFINNTNSPSNILPFKMSYMLNQAVSVWGLDHSSNCIPFPKEIKKLFKQIKSCHTKQPPKTCQRGSAIKWCMHTHIYIYTHIYICIYIYIQILYTHFPTNTNVPKKALPQCCVCNVLPALAGLKTLAPKAFCTRTLELCPERQWCLVISIWCKPSSCCNKKQKSTTHTHTHQPKNTTHI